MWIFLFCTKIWYPQLTYNIDWINYWWRHSLIIFYYTTKTKQKNTSNSGWMIDFPLTKIFRIYHSSKHSIKFHTRSNEKFYKQIQSLKISSQLKLTRFPLYPFEYLLPILYPFEPNQMFYLICHFLGFPVFVLGCIMTSQGWW